MYIFGFGLNWKGVIKDAREPLNTCPGNPRLLKLFFNLNTVGSNFIPVDKGVLTAF